MKLGIALSGGGIKGFAHIGFLKVLFENNIKPDVISGTSAGAIVGSLIANGYSPQDVYSLRKKISFSSIIHLNNPLNGISSMNGLRRSLNYFLDGVKFKDLKIKLIVVATDLIKGKPYFLKKGNVIDAVLASSCVAGLFDPVKINGKLFIDGGYTLPLPVSPLKTDKIISVTLEHLKPKFPRATLLKTITRSSNIMRRMLIIKEEEKADIKIRIPTYNFNTYSIKQAYKLYDLGIRTAKRKIRQIKKLLKE